MTKPSDIEKLDCLTEGELADLVACDQALSTAWARLNEARNQVKDLGRQLAESTDLDVSALSAELATAMAPLTALPIEIGALTRRRVLLHLQALKTQRDRLRVRADAAKPELDRLSAEGARIEKAIAGMHRPDSGYPSMANPGRINPDHVATQAEAIAEFDKAVAKLHAEQRALKEPGGEAYRAYHQADTMAEACNSWASDYGRFADGRYPGAPGRADLVCSLDQPASWGPVANAQGERAQRDAARW